MEAFLNYIRDMWRICLNIANGFSFKDLIDILVVTFIIYSLIKLIRETRAGQLIKGVMLFVVLFIVSQLFDFVILSEILRNIVTYALVVMVVVFQPEIRKALEQMGRSKVGETFSNVIGVKNAIDTAEVKEAVDAVVEATAMLQQMRMGALIVFERKTRLGEVIETGTMVNAEPSAQLISNIFFNKAPLHDGAMIIKNGKIHSAGCILPLTSNDTLSLSLGTRHRAALGVSEVSDCVVVVVSEETGQISIAVNGKLSRNYNRVTLREALEKMLVSTSEGADGGKKLFGIFKLPVRKKGSGKIGEK